MALKSLKQSLSNLKKLSPEIYQGLGIKVEFEKNKGFKVIGTVKVSCGESMGLKEGEYITSLDGKDITKI